MKKIIQKITSLVALSVWLIGHMPVFAVEPCADDNECPWYFGIKAWAKFPMKTIMNRSCLGVGEGAIGPFVEWKPCDQIGIQTGLMYSHNVLFTAGFNRITGKVVSGWSDKPEPIQENALIDMDRVDFHAISIPLSIRFYPGNDRQFALHGGIPLDGASI